jgi:hypothetical protein
LKDGSVLGDENGRTIKSQTTKSQYHAHAENRGRDGAASPRVVEPGGAVTPGGWHSAGSVRHRIGRMKSGTKSLWRPIIDNLVNGLSNLLALDYRGHAMKNASAGTKSRQAIFL